jgi:hypothetical protein
MKASSVFKECYEIKEYRIMEMEKGEHKSRTYKKMKGA